MTVLLTDEEIMDTVLDEGLGVIADDNTRAIAKAQLKSLYEDIKERPCNAACQRWKDDLLRDLRGEIQ